MRVDICVNRNVTEVATIYVENFEKLEELVKANELFDEIDNQRIRFKETCGEILGTNITIDDSTTYILEDDNTLTKINEE